MGASLTKQQGLPAHTQPACITPDTTITTSAHNPPIMASSPSAFDWECGACASFNKGGKYCPMCATLRPKRKALLAGLVAEDVAANAAVVAVPAVVVKAIPSAPMHKAVVGTPTAIAALPTAVAKPAGTVVGAPVPVAKKAKAPVAREAKASKGCAPATADVPAPAEVVPAPTPVAKAKNLINPRKYHLLVHPHGFQTAIMVGCWVHHKLCLCNAPVMLLF